MTRRLYSWTLLLSLSAAPLYAGTPASDPVTSLDQLSTKVKTGDTIYVLDTSARETSGMFARVSQTSLALLVDGQLREIPIDEVRQVARRGDPVWNGALIGAAFGGIVGATVDVGFCLVEPCSGPSAGERTAFGLLLGGVYGALGAGIDALIHGRTVVYRVTPQRTVRLFPVLSGQRAGAVLSIGF